jgi:hypothetical protein
VVRVCLGVRLDPFKDELGPITRIFDFLSAVAYAIVLLPAILSKLIIVRARVSYLSHAKTFKRWFIPHQSDEGGVF